MYSVGEGVTGNAIEAARWYRRGADAGVPEAMVNLGEAYSEGKGVRVDQAEAVRWYRLALDAHAKRPAELRSHPDMPRLVLFNLGVMYERGWGVERNYAEAL